MAEKRRGRLAGSQGKVKSRKMVEKLQLEGSSSEDEAPEEVMFEDSKAAAVNRMREALETARREKELLKDKRRKRQALFQEQKKKRLLPDDILEEIDAKVSRFSCVFPEGEQRNEEVITSRIEESDETGGEEGEEKVTMNKRNNIKRMRRGCLVRRLKYNPDASVQQQNACDFIQSRLYGRGSNRTTINQFLSLENKRSQNKNAAVQFLNKQWGLGKKEKAEKFRKQWLHKQKMLAR
ncbi:nucleolar protein 7 [Arapaima gigas]